MRTSSKVLCVFALLVIFASAFMIGAHASGWLKHDEGMLKTDAIAYLVCLIVSNVALLVTYVLQDDKKEMNRL